MARIVLHALVILSLVCSGAFASSSAVLMHASADSVVDCHGDVPEPDAGDSCCEDGACRCGYVAPQAGLFVLAVAKAMNRDFQIAASPEYPRTAVLAPFRPPQVA